MRHLSSSVRLGCMVPLLVIGIVSAVDAQNIVKFDPPSSSYTVPQAINLFGQVTGYYQDTAGFHGFLRQPDGAIFTFDVALSNGLPTPTFPADINLQGAVTGYIVHPAVALGFLRQPDGTAVTFAVTGSTPSVTESEPAPHPGCPVDGTAGIAVNARGQITGSYQLPSSFCAGFLRQRDGTIITFNVQPQLGPVIPMTFPQAINLLGQIVGYYHDANGNRGFLRERKRAIVRFDPPNSTGTAPQAINLFGQIAGYYQDANFVLHGFVRQRKGAIISFDPPGSISTQANAINMKSEITGFYVTADGRYHGFVRRRSGTIESFDIPTTGNGGTFPRDINDRGQVVGYYQDSNFALHGFIRSEQ